MSRLSVTVITYNEEDNLSRCMESLKGLADEVIVVDSGSDDETVSIARKYGGKVFFRKFDDFSSQKNWAVSKASSEWILSLDADEQLSEELADEIKEAIKNKNYLGYLIPRRNFILGAEIKHSRWSPDKHIWLWRKDFGKWVGNVHEEVMVRGMVGQLKNSKIHYSHKTLSDFLKSNNLYSTLLAHQMSRNKTDFSFVKMFWEAIFEFNIRFFYKMGFLDGWRGFVLAYLMAIYKLTVWIKIWELESKDQKHK